MDTVALQIELEYTLKMAELIEEKNQKIAKHMAGKLEAPKLPALPPATSVPSISAISKVTTTRVKSKGGIVGPHCGRNDGKLPKTPMAQRQGKAVLDVVQAKPEGITFKGILKELSSLGENRVRQLLNSLRNEGLITKVVGEAGGQRYKVAE